MKPQLRRGLGDNFSLLAVKHKPFRSEVDKSFPVVFVNCWKITLCWRNDVHNTKIRRKVGSFGLWRFARWCRHLLQRAHSRAIAIGQSLHGSSYSYVKTLLIGSAREINTYVRKICISKVLENMTVTWAMMTSSWRAHIILMSSSLVPNWKPITWIEVLNLMNRTKF